MKVEFEADEAWDLMSLIVAKVAEEVDLADSDRANVRRWRSAMQPSGEGMRLLTDKLNAAFEETLARKKRSHIRKPDWRR